MSGLSLDSEDTFVNKTDLVMLTSESGFAWRDMIGIIYEKKLKYLCDSISFGYLTLSLW